MYSRIKNEELIKSGRRFRDLLKVMLEPEINFVKIILIFTAFTSVLNLIIPVAIQSVINNIGVRHMIQPIIIMSSILLFFLIFSGIFQSINFYVIEILKRRLFIRYGAVIVERLTRYNDQNYQTINSPASLNRYFDVLICQSSMVMFFVDGSAFILQALIGLVLLAFYHPYFLIFTIVIIAIFIFCWIWNGPRGVAAGTPEANGKYNVVAWVEDLGRARTMFMSNRGRNFAIKKYGDLIDRWLIVRQNLFKEQFEQNIMLQTANAFIYALLIGLGSLLVLNQELSIGQLVAAALVVAIILSNLSRLQNFFISVYDYSTSLDEIAEFYDHPLENENLHAKRPTHYDLKFQNIHFHPNFFLDQSFAYGKRNYILVKSFSAKKIFLNLIYGLRNPDSGDFFIGDLHVNDINWPELRDNVTVIKEGRFFNGTILANLTSFVEREVSYTEIDAALEATGVKDNIMGLPEKLETVLMPSGHPLSASQLLALQFARAIIEQPKILVVTTDFEKIASSKRKKIFQYLSQQGHPWTLLFFSQRVYPEKGFDKFFQIVRKNILEYKSYQEFVGDINNYESY